MAKSYIGEFTHYLDDTGNLKDMLGAARRRARFFAAVIDAITWKCPASAADVEVKCCIRGCSGKVLASLQDADGKITWWCPACEQKGVISGWQGTKWDHSKDANPTKPKYTPKEGQYLAFIYYYGKLHRKAPSEGDMQLFFQVTPPAVHGMVLKLEKHGFISREPGKPRSIRLLLKREDLPDLD